MLITTDLWRTILIGMLGVGWLTLVAPVTAQDAPVAVAETTAVTATETSSARAEPIAPATVSKSVAEPEEDTIADQVATASVLLPSTEPQPVATNISTNVLPAMTNAALSGSRASDASGPGWWFEAALKQDSKYPRFLGVRFAEVARAVIIETPNRKLTVGQPLVYRLWVCNDLPQPVKCRVAYAIRKGEIVITRTNTLDFVIRGSKVQAVGRFKQSTESLAPGTYTIDATLRDQTGKLLHHMTETFELTATKSARP